MSKFLEYREAKAKLDTYKKVVESLSKELKEEMKEYPKVEEEGYVYERKVSVRTKLDEEALADYLFEKGYSKAVKVTSKVVLEEDCLSEMLENGELDVEIIDKFSKSTEVITLYCRRIKEEREIDNGTF